MDTAPYPFVSIIVLTWNGKVETLECLRSLLNVSYPRMRIILVDNASTDGTAEAVRREFTAIDVLVNETNLRYAGGNNRGISFALEHGADAVLLLNNDTIVDRDFLAELAKVLQSDDAVGIVGPKILYHSDPQKIWYAGGKIDWRQGWFSHIGIRDIDRGQFDGTASTDYVSGCCMLIKREVIERVGMLDEKFFIYGEDTDLCLRTSYAGYKVMYQSQARVWHKVSASSGKFSWFKNSNKFKSQIRLLSRYAKWYHWITIPFGILWNLMRSILAIAFRK